MLKKNEIARFGSTAPPTTCSPLWDAQEARPARRPRMIAQQLQPPSGPERAAAVRATIGADAV